MRQWRARAQAIVNRLGYRIERLRPTSSDPFDDQAAFLRRCGLAGGVVFDLGAHVGTTVARYRALLPDATIFAFEPSPGSFAKLLEATRQDRAVRAFNIAASDRDGTARLHLFRHEQADSLLPASADAGRYYHATLFDPTGAIEVKTVALDSFCRSEGIPQIAVLKMDVQGAELPVLQGARELLAAGRVALIYAEVGFAPIYEGQATFYEVRDYLTRHGYEMFNLYGLYRGANGRLVVADALFLRRDLIATPSGDSAPDA